MSRNSNSYSISTYNCNTPTHVETYQKHSICQTSENVANQEQTYQVVQQHRSERSHGYRCQLKYSEFLLKCGMFAHIKLLRIPKINHIETLTIDYCMDLILRRKFRHQSDGTTYLVKLNQLNIYRITTIGTLEEQNDEISCTGGNLHLQGKEHTNILQLFEYKLLITPETFVLHDNHVEVETRKISLPCQSNLPGCVTLSGTFTYQPRSTQECKLMWIREVKLSPILHTYLVNLKYQLLFNQTGRTYLPNCPKDLITTQLEDIFLIHGPRTTIQHLDSHELEISQEIRMIAEFAAFYTETKFLSVDKTIQEVICQSDIKNHGEEPHQLQGETFLLNHGDIVYSYRCKQKIVTIRETNSCYQDIAIKDNDFPFAHPQTRVLKKTSIIQPCSIHFPLIIKTLEGWVSINPKLKMIPTPKLYRESSEKEHSKPKHLDFSQGGLYSKGELEEWNQLILFPTYRKGLIDQISQGSCQLQDQCPRIEGQQMYDVNRLIPNIITEVNLWVKLKTWIHEKGDELAFAVLCIVILKIALNLILLALTIMTEGLESMIALAVKLFCPEGLAYKKVKQRNRRHKQNQEDPEAEPTH